jgi:hypothetical protein
MSPEVKQLSDTLDVLRSKLVNTPRTADGFGEMRALLNELTSALIDAGDKADKAIAEEVARVSKAVVEERESNKGKLGGWMDVLRPIISAVGAVTKIASLGNPLALLLPA